MFGMGTGVSLRSCTPTIRHDDLSVDMPAEPRKRPTGTNESQSLRREAELKSRLRSCSAEDFFKPTTSQRVAMRRRMVGGRASTVSTARLKTLLSVHLRPINLVVYQGSFVFRLASLILWGASRLDAFSGYPCRM